jgi:hypothetical protein
MSEYVWGVTAYRNTLTVAIHLSEGRPSPFGGVGWRERWTPYAFKNVSGWATFKDAKKRAERVVTILNDRPLSLQVVLLDENPMPKLREMVINTLKEIDRDG